MTGQTVAQYAIVDALPWKGRGSLLRGVYRRDNRLVELYFVPAEELSHGEAEALAQRAAAAQRFAHPNCLAILEVMPNRAGVLVATEAAAGITLEERIAGQGITVADGLKFAVQIADTLLAASRADLALSALIPEQVVIGDDGLVKLRGLGFADTHTGEEPAPRPRDSLGDALFSFGLLLGVMLTGRLSHQSQQALLREMIEEQIEGSGPLAEEAAAKIEAIRSRCLAPGTASFEDLARIKADLLEVRKPLEFASLVAAVPGPPAPSRRVIWPFLVGGAILVPAAVGLVISSLKPSAGLAPPELRTLTSSSAYTTEPAVSPDGKLLAYVSDAEEPGNLDLWVRPLDGSSTPRLLSGLPADEREPAFSPDGSRIALRIEQRGGGIYTLASAGGEPELLARQGRRPRYSPDGRWIAYWTGSEGQLDLGSLYLVPATGGEPRQLVKDFHSAQFPVWSPDSRRILFAGVRRQGDFTDFWVVDPEDNLPMASGASPALRRKKLPAGVPGYWAGGWLYFSTRNANAGNLWRMRIADQSGRVKGQPEQLTFGDDLDLDPVPVPSGGFVFTRFRQSAALWSLPVDPRTGAALGAPAPILQDGFVNAEPSASADGRRIVFSSNQGGSPDIWLLDRQTGAQRQITENTAADFRPTGIISQDGERVAYTVLEDRRTSVWVAPASGERPATRVCRACAPPSGWSPNGWILLVSRQAANFTVDTLDVETGELRTLAEHRRFTLLGPRFSPDGLWAVFHAIVHPHRRRIFAIPYRGRMAVREADWIPLTDGQHLDRDAQWGAEPSLVFFASDRDNVRGLWARRVDPETRQPAGEPFLVYRPPAGRGIRLGGRIGEFTVTRDALIFSQSEATGTIFEASWPAADGK